jgi:thymidylate synthase (FAD)
MIKVDYIQHMGDSKMVVNSARVSFGGDNNNPLSERDEKLIKYLADHKHYSPFEHLSLTVKIECPLYIRSQIHRHRTFAYNEISRRYTSKDMTFHVPDTFRKQSEYNKQASYGALDEPEHTAVKVELEEFHQKSLELYESLLSMGVCKEQARGVLVQNLNTEFYMSGNLRNWVHFINLRDHQDAQVEVQLIAKEVRDILIDKFGISAKILLTKGE